MLSEILIATETIALYQLEGVGHTQEGVTEYVVLQIRVLYTSIFKCTLEYFYPGSKQYKPNGAV